MSYKFNLDHTLTIGDIHDMITIDIKPETRCSVTGGDIEIHGYLTFRGSYLTPDLGEAPFEGSVPLDITLPYLGGAPDVKPEVIAFDYRVQNKESLTLNLEIALRGYETEMNENKVMDAWVDPVEEAPVYEEAVIEPFDFVPISPETDDSVPVEDFHPRGEVSMLEEETYYEVVEEMEMSIEEIEEEIEEIEEIPYSPLIDIEERVVEVEAIQFEEVEASEEPLAPIVVPVVEEVEVRREPKLTESAAALMDELFAMKRGPAFKEEETARNTPSVAPVEVVREEEIIDKVDEVVIFEEVEESEEAVVSIVIDSVARQFSDGKTTIKMIYVGDESETLGGVLERHAATLDDVWNLEALADGVKVGDCVMLRYEKTV